MVDVLTGPGGQIALAQLLVIPLAALLAARLLRRSPARAHAVLVAGVALTVAAPALTLLAAALELGRLPGANIHVSALAVTPAGLEDDAAGRAATPWLLWTVLGGWLALTALLALRTLTAFVRGRRLSRSGVAWIAPHVEASARRACARTGVRADAIEVTTSPRVGSPVIYAWSRPARILVPADRCGELTPAALEAVLVHEIAHRRRCDHVWQLLAQVVAVVVPWHPAVLLARRAVERLSDRACDDWVVATGDTPAAYADTLLRFVRGTATARPFVAALGSEGAVSRRIRAILEAPPRHAHCGRPWLALVAFAAVLIGGALAVGQPGPTRFETADAFDAATLRTHPVQAVPAVVDLGEVTPGTPGRGRVRLVNLGQRPVRVVASKVACGCTTIEPIEPAALRPGDVLEVGVAMTSPTTPKTRKTKSVTFMFEGQDPVTVKLELVTAG
ncbi:MAG: M56 family metallopeptidase [Planctomycetota bacterium]|jgi:beta-lactamase regulating signal transducer with metallopeptidase domain